MRVSKGSPFRWSSGAQEGPLNQHRCWAGGGLESQAVPSAGLSGSTAHRPGPFKQRRRHWSKAHIRRHLWNSPQGPRVPSASLNQRPHSLCSDWPCLAAGYTAPSTWEGRLGHGWQEGGQVSGQSRLSTCSGSRWGCAPQEMQQESGQSLGGARSPGAEDSRGRQT